MDNMTDLNLRVWFKEWVKKKALKFSIVDFSPRRTQICRYSTTKIKNRETWRELMRKLREWSAYCLNPVNLRGTLRSHISEHNFHYSPPIKLNLSESTRIYSSYKTLILGDSVKVLPHMYYRKNLSFTYKFNMPFWHGLFVPRVSFRYSFCGENFFYDIVEYYTTLKF